MDDTPEPPRRGPVVAAAVAVAAIDFTSTFVIAAGALATGTRVSAPSQEIGWYVGIPLAWHGLAPFAVATFAGTLALVLYRTRRDLALGVAIGAVAAIAMRTVLTMLVMTAWILLMAAAVAPHTLRLW